METSEMAESVSSEEKQQVDLNAATAEQLEVIPGIGPALSKRIVEYRQAKGPFVSPQELTAVSGIGPALYDRISSWLTVAPLQPEEAVPTGPPEIEPLEEVAPLADEEQLEEAAAPTAAPAEEEAAPAPEQPVAEEVAAPAAAAPRPPLPAPKWPRGIGLAWIASALLGAVLGVMATLLILAIINGSLSLSRAPAIVDLNDRVQAVARDIDGLSGEVNGLSGRVNGLEKRLAEVEGLPARMNAVEGSVEELSGAVRDVAKGVRTLNERMGAVEEGLAAMQAHAEKVDGFFEGLQSLLVEVFGTAQPEPSTSE